ncbi:Nuclear pore complex protein [Cardamine amara subsp. amara]|uniref:Nuclear pore complex protein n=1 Tax=Cardamine amara subsp. amara TaxID=228776 RepID=A0ABD1AXE1_CARAN
MVLAQDEEYMITTEERMMSEPDDVQPTFADCKRFLNLSKIAYVAAKDADSKFKVERVEADLKLLKLHGEIIKGLATDEQARN